MQVIIIDLIPANFRRIRTEYFGYTMEQVAKATNLSVGTIPPVRRISASMRYSCQSSPQGSAQSPGALPQSPV